MTLDSMQRRLEPEFQFAGFNFPKYAYQLPRGTLAERLKDRKRPVCGPSWRAPKPNSDGIGFYLADDFHGLRDSPIQLRWKWCDEVSSHIDHTGWFTDDFQDQKIRGVVFQLPRSRGFLAGWSMGVGWASEIDCVQVYADDAEAADAADYLAKIAAEEERLYQEGIERNREAEEAGEAEEHF